MEEAMKLSGEYHDDWHHVAREFGDHDMVTEGGWWSPYTTMQPVNDSTYIGDWLPVEDVCREVVRLRGEVAMMKAQRRRVAQSLIEAVGAPGPELLDETVERACTLLRNL